MQDDHVQVDKMTHERLILINIHRNILPAGHVVATGGVGAGHDPGGSQGNGVHFVGRVRVPHDQLAVLGGRYQVSRVCAPVHRVHLDKKRSVNPELRIIIISLSSLTLDKCPLNVLLVLIWILPMASILTVA